MTIITAPYLPISQISWSLDRPATVNRSAYTGARRVVANPWHGIWRAKVDLAPQQGEANFYALRAFFASLRGQVNTFQIPATEGPQYSGSNYATIDAVAQGADVAAIGTLGTELVTNGTFDTATTGWTPLNSTLSVVSARLRVTSTIAATWGEAWQTAIPVTPGQTYRFTWQSFAGTAAGQVFSIGDYPSNGESYFNNSGAAGPIYFTPTTNSIVIKLKAEASTSGQYADFDNISLKQVTAPPLVAGQYLTFPLPSANEQLAMITSVANGNFTFEPSIREAVAASTTVECISPYCLVSLDQSSFGWDVAQWRRYGMSFGVEEAF